MSFKGVEKKIARKEGVPMKNAGAILANSSRNASPAAKKKNPNLLKVKGGKTTGGNHIHAGKRLATGVAPEQELDDMDDKGVAGQKAAPTFPTRVGKKSAPARKRATGKKRSSGSKPPRGARIASAMGAPSTGMY